MKVEIVKTPTKRVRGKYDPIWKALLALKPGQAVKVTDLSGAGRDNFCSLAVCLRIRVRRMRRKDGNVRLHQVVCGAAIYLWLRAAKDEQFPAVVSDDMFRTETLRK